MNLRLASVLVPLCLISGGAAADSLPAPVPAGTEDYLNLLRVDLRAAKAEIVTNALELTPGELERFWPIYREYDAALVRLNEERVATLRDFAAHYASIDDAQAKDLTRRSLDFQRKRLDLLEKYYERVARAFNPATAARFLQLEHQLLTLVDVQIASELPLVPRQALISQAR
jgi:hypothetical protein